MQACGVRDRGGEYKAAGARVLGVSPDPVEKVKRFADKFDLDFTLLADADHAVADAYGTWVEKKNYGKTYMGRPAGHIRHRPRGQDRQGLPKGLAEDARRRHPRGTRRAVGRLSAQA